METDILGRLDALYERLIAEKEAAVAELDYRRACDLRDRTRRVIRSGTYILTHHTSHVVTTSFSQETPRRTRYRVG